MKIIMPNVGNRIDSRKQTDSKEQIKLGIFEQSIANWSSNALKFGTTENGDILL